MKRRLFSGIGSEHLAKSVMLEETGSPLALRAITIFGALIVGAFLVWAGLMQLDEVASAPGEILPNSNVTRIQHLHGGAISEMLVKDGDLVAAGQILIRLNPLPYRGQLEQAQAELEMLAAQKVRLEALIDGHDPDFAQLEIENSEFADDQMRIYTQLRTAMDANRAALENQIRQLQAELEEINKRAGAVARQRSLLKQELALYEEGVGTNTQYLSLKRQYDELWGELERIPAQRTIAREKITETRNRIAAQDAVANQQFAEELAAIDEHVVQLRNTVRRYLQDVEYLEIASPVGGYVHGLQAHSVGEIVGPGDTIMEIVPEDSRLVAIIQISSRDIGHVKVGQPVTLKFATYNYGRYGGLKGSLTEISPTTFLDRAGNPYYRASVTVDKNYVGSDPKRYPIMSGMTLTADIKTGSKTVLEYLLKPIHASAASALRER